MSKRRLSDCVGPSPSINDIEPQLKRLALDPLAEALAAVDALVVLATDIRRHEPYGGFASLLVQVADRMLLVRALYLGGTGIQDSLKQELHADLAEALRRYNSEAVAQGDVRCQQAVAICWRWVACV